LPRFPDGPPAQMIAQILLLAERFTPTALNLRGDGGRSSERTTQEKKRLPEAQVVTPHSLPLGPVPHQSAREEWQRLGLASWRVGPSRLRTVQSGH
jgi:hypothetical protein